LQLLADFVAEVALSDAIENSPAFQGWVKRSRMK
jgi:hypothetical protein